MLDCENPGVWSTAAGVVGCIVSLRTPSPSQKRGKSQMGFVGPASRPGASTVTHHRARYLAWLTGYAPVRPKHPPWHSLHRRPAQCPDRITLRSSPAHRRLSLVWPRRSADRRRRQRRFWRQGVPREGRQVHESGLQVRTRPSRHAPTFCSVSLTLTSHANVPRSVFQADFRRQSSSLAPVEHVF